MSDPKTRHLHDELAANSSRVVAETRYGPVTGGRAANGTAVWLEIPYGLPPGRFQDPEPLPDDFRYEEKEYIREASYCVQPTNDGQASGTPFQDKVGYGQPTENPLFLNIVCPPEFPENKGPFPVKVYIHGGFLQFGSPHGLKFQEQYVSDESKDVRVNIGYRLSAFGFLACDEPKVNGNFGFKDQWLGLKWVSKNIASFGGDPNDIQLMGLSAGGHSVHQCLHHASRLPQGVKAPFQSAVLLSNAIILKPKTRQELRPQYQALCRALSLDPEDPHTLQILRDPTRIPASRIAEVIETDAVGTEYGTYRACLDDDWMAADPEPMTWQASGQLAAKLLEKGVKTVIVGDTKEEWYLYSIAHPISTPADIKPNLERYYPADMVDRMMKMYRTLPDDASEEESKRLFGEILSDWQVHFPARLLARDLYNAGYPVLRYEVRWVPDEARPEGYVTHASDTPVWHFRIPTLESDQPVAKNWLEAIKSETQSLKADRRPVEDVLTLKEDKQIEWRRDAVWEEKMRLLDAL
ncbi:carboxylesterase [Dendrothele bispora CBS 962.96]|uniref:Carboxylic ester hydrolase n=1 Tax=Dendrothele bispora (strain CBS 962.96) TaxID=1314807 RepID=A0A4S8N1D6_DENBC|nr:carboxylesterase [Dendrothele bispora CBS 962.96]